MSVDTPPPTLADLLRDGVLDAELAALIWLLLEEGTPLVVSGEASGAKRAEVAEALMGFDPRRDWLLLDADTGVPALAELSGALAAGTALVISLRATDLQAVLERLSAPPAGLPEDAVRRLGVVLVLGREYDVPLPGGGRGPGSVRVLAAHYLRPTERDGQGHIQRRPPAVLASWDPGMRAFEHFAWGVTPELADRAGRSQADLEERQVSRAAFLAGLAAGGPMSPAEQAARVVAHLAAEPPRVPAPPRDAARPSPFGEGHRHAG